MAISGVLLAVAVSAAADAAPVSALDPAGADAQLIADVFWWMAFGAAAVWAAAVGFLSYCLRAPRHRPQPVE
jgi:cytochrome c oxidase subunit 2